MSKNEGGRDLFVAPKFHKALKDLSTSQGECIVLECRVKGVPPPVITWTREGDVIEDSPDFRLLHRGEIATLVIGEAFPEDTGRFMCEASNKAGTATTSCKLVVKGGGYHTISTKSAAAPQAATQPPKPTKVLPAYSSSSNHPSPAPQPHFESQPLSQSQPQVQAPRNVTSCYTLTPTQVSKLNFTPRNPCIYVIDDVQPTSSHNATSPVNTRSPSPVHQVSPRAISPIQLVGPTASYYSSPRSLSPIARSSSPVARNSPSPQPEFTRNLPSPQPEFTRNLPSLQPEFTRNLSEISESLPSPPPEITRNEPFHQPVVQSQPSQKPFARNVPSPQQFAQPSLDRIQNSPQPDCTRNSPSPVFQQTPTMTSLSPSYDHNANESHNFKAEKDRLVQEVAKNATSPSKGGKQRSSSSRTLAIIERDIQQRLSMSSPTPTSPTQDGNVQGDYILYSPTLAAVLEIEPQEYKISGFEQRLMNEIEYRLERTPPINEDPEDALFDEVPLADQRAPTFVNTLKNFKALDGTSTKFVCKVSANPKAMVFWFKDGKQISKRSQHYIQKSSGDGHHELNIAHLCIEDDGNYTALASNPQGKVCSTGRLAVVTDRQASVNDKAAEHPTSPRTSSQCRSLSPRMTSPPHSISPTSDAVFQMPDKGELAADEVSPVEKYYRPTFIQKPAPDTKADEGKLVRFDVKVTGLPTPDIAWLINGRPVRQDQLHKVLVRENNVHSLLLERASPMDEGQYTIVATNKAGSTSVHVQLHVTPREFMTAPAFVQRLSAQCVAEGDPVRLEARVVGAPKPIITWKKGSDQVMQDARTQLYQDDSGYVCLQITQTSMKDAAWYTCSATNKAGISSCNCKLDVYCPTSNVPSNRRRIRTPHRYANLAKVAGVDMREALTPDAQAQHFLPESDEL